MKRPEPHRAARARAAALALAFALLAPAAAARADAPETYWLDGYEVAVSLRPLRTSFVLGEPITLVLGFENRSAADLELLLSGEQGPGWPDDFEVRVTGPDGEALPRPDGEEGRRETSYTNSFVRAVRSHYTASAGMGIHIPLASWAKIEKPGLYTVALRRGVRAGPYGRRYRLFPGTTRPAVELRARTRFRVAGGGPDRIGRLVDELGETMLACDQSASVEAATRLGELKDERVLKYMVEAVARCRNPSIRYTALGSFAKFRTDAGFEGLRLAASDADEDFRTVAANYLAASKHPKAKALLISLRKDPYYGVRMIVLIALEGMDTEAARRHIWEMTHDEHPQVKAEALRFLQDQGARPPRR